MTLKIHKARHKFGGMKKKIGRPTVDSEPVTLRLPRELIEAIDDRRRLEQDLPTRPEMIRRALVQWLALAEGEGEGEDE